MSITAGIHMHHFDIPLRKTNKIVFDAIENAEKAASRQIKKYYHNANEEFVTFILYGQIQYQFAKANKASRIERSFADDLKNALKQHTCTCVGAEMEIDSTARGLVAEILLHNRKEEGKTGGDFGLLHFAPSAKVQSDEIVIDPQCVNGLLCQAKMKYRDRKCTFTKSQLKALPSTVGFLALPIYEYLDDQKTTLQPINWFSCKDISFKSVKTHLHEDTIPDSDCTRSIIQKLAKGIIGTNKQSDLDRIKAPSGRFHIEIRIHWKNRPPDGEPIKIKLKNISSVENTTKQYVHAANS